MGRLLHIAGVALIALAVLAPVTSAQANHSDEHQRAPRGGTAVEGEYIVMLLPGASATAVQRAFDVRNPRSFSAAFNGFAGRVPEGRLNALRRDPRVEAVVPDRVIRGQPGRPGKPRKTTTSTSGEIVPEGVRAIGAAPGAGLGVTGAGIGVAILDSGVDAAHVDLRVSPACYDAFGGDCSDDSGHGTHVAGTVAALQNGFGVVGVAPGATIYPVKVLDADAGGSDAALIGGIEWVLQNADRVFPAIRIANLSLGRPGHVDDNPALAAAVNALVGAGITVVAAAGNDPFLAATDQIPATYPDVITVASSTALGGSSRCTAAPTTVPADSLSFFSSYAPRIDGIGVDITAPGERREDVSEACLIEGAGILSLFPGGQLAEMAGTSMAAPLVAGVAALLLERLPSLEPKAVAAAIRAGARDVASAPRASLTNALTPSGGILDAPGSLGLR